MEVEPGPTSPPPFQLFVLCLPVAKWLMTFEVNNKMTGELPDIFCLEKLEFFSRLEHKNFVVLTANTSFTLTASLPSRGAPILDRAIDIVYLKNPEC